MIEIINNDNIEALKKFPDNWFSSMITDPPYGLKFMGKKWDYEIPSVELWKETLRVLKPGAFILVACGTRTQHRMVVNIEDAGFEIRDIISWIYGSGFPKSLDVSKAIDAKIIFGNSNKTQFKNLDGEKGISDLGYTNSHADNDRPNNYNNQEYNKTVNLKTTEAKQWEGWGTALKPAQELWTLARKPPIGTIAENVLNFGVGGLNIDASRIDLNGGYKSKANGRTSQTGLDDNYNPSEANQQDTKGRFPANIIFDPYTAKLLDEQTGNLKSGAIGNLETPKTNYAIFGKYKKGNIHNYESSEGGGSRFFYCAKPSTEERNKGLENFEKKQKDESRDLDKPGGNNPRNNGAKQTENFHPTVKPVALMRYLVTLITPPNGIVLDPFNGSGTTGIACKLEDLSYMGIEREKEYCEISEARIKAYKPEPKDNQLNLF